MRGRGSRLSATSALGCLSSELRLLACVGMKERVVGGFRVEAWVEVNKDPHALAGHVLIEAVPGSDLRHHFREGCRQFAPRLVRDLRGVIEREKAPPERLL